MTGPRAPSPPRIGISAAFSHADPERKVFKGKTLAYVEQELAEFVMSAGALPLLIPQPAPGLPVTLADYARTLDGLVLQGGADVAPETYGEQPLRQEWAGDRVRDLYELELYRAFVAERKPVLGVCRGAQFINIAQGGTLYQDINTQVQADGTLIHRNWDIYDSNTHALAIEPGGWMAGWYPGGAPATVCTVHHQAIKDLGSDLVIEARAVPDGIIEAVRHTGPTWIYGVQWHPEWHDAGDGRLDGAPILRAFLDAVAQRKATAPPHAGSHEDAA